MASACGVQLEWGRWASHQGGRRELKNELRLRSRRPGRASYCTRGRGKFGNREKRSVLENSFCSFFRTPDSCQEAPPPPSSFPLFPPFFPFSFFVCFFSLNFRLNQYFRKFRIPSLVNAVQNFGIFPILDAFFPIFSRLSSQEPRIFFIFISSQAKKILFLAHGR